MAVIKKPAPIIIVRRAKGGHGGGHHGGAWKVAYADFVTALMAFFMVMWLVNQDPSVKKAIAGYFRDPGVFAQQRSVGVLTGGGPGVEQGQTNQHSPTRANTEEATRAEQRTLAKAAEGIRSAIEQMKDVADLRDQIEFTLTSEGLRVELVDRPGSSFFASGSARLLGESEHLLTAVATEISKLNNEVVIEGHTDSLPYTPGATYGNWELSTDRANAARRAMEAAGLSPTYIKAVRGYADTDLRHPDNPSDPSNRRVSILIRSNGAARLDKMVHDGEAVRSAVPSIKPPETKLGQIAK
jgi:chemotaxis protein MotB